ncbi:hypothetical protein TGPRC2_245560B, partial [Toxoplasma gondii TgCatPRC2]
ALRAVIQTSRQQPSA